MNLDLVNFYFGLVLTIIGIPFVIFFVFIVREPKDGAKERWVILWHVRQSFGRIVVMLVSMYVIFLMLGFIVQSVRDIPYIVREEPKRTRVEILTGFQSNRTRSRRIYVRDVETGQVFEIQIMDNRVESGTIYNIEFLPRTGWASLQEVDE